MNEEKMLYHVSGAPFVRSKTDTQRIMLDVLIAFLIYKPLSPLLHR